MKLNIGKVDLSKIKKLTVIEITSFAIVFVALSIYYYPHLFNNKDVMAAAKIKADNAVFTSKVLEEFASNKNLKSSDIAQKVSDELNITTVNPYNKKEKAFTFEQNCKGCNNVEYNDELKMIILTTYNKKGELIARTVIKPPSFVTYNKEDDEK